MHVLDDSASLLDQVLRNCCGVCQEVEGQLCWKSSTERGLSSAELTQYETHRSACQTGKCRLSETDHPNSLPVSWQLQTHGRDVAKCDDSLGHFECNDAQCGLRLSVCAV